MFNIILIFVTLCILCQGSNPDFRYDYKYDRDARGWLKLHRSPMHWENARLQCYHEGAILASPLDKPLELAILKLLREHKTSCPEVMFSGVNSLFAQGVHTSVEGVPLERMSIHWSPNEPVYVPTSCLVFFSNGTMGSKNCNDHYPFICYKDHEDFKINECGTVDDEYHFNNVTKNCYKYHSEEADWHRAYAACQAEGAHLAILSENIDWIAVKLRQKIAFIGYKFIGNSWWDIHGNRISPEIKTPDIQDKQQGCGGLNWNNDFVANWCSDEHPFICEKTVHSLVNRGGSSRTV